MAVWAGYLHAHFNNATARTFCDTRRHVVASVPRGQSGKLIGGCIPVAGTGGPAPSCASFNDGATTATVTFRTVIQDKYSDTFPSGDPSLNEGDGLSNSVSVSGSPLSETNTNNTTGQSEADGSSAGVSIAKECLQN